ncbi:MAG TPA: ATP-binding protein [Trueperaceae bacterium]
MQERLEDRPVVRPPREGVHRSLVSAVRSLLLALLAVPLLLLFLSLLFLGPGSLSVEGIVVLVVFALVAAAGLARLRSGRLGQAVGLVIVGVLAGLAWETALTGVVGFSAFLFAYSIPIALAALIAGRRALIASAAASIAIVVIVHLLERAGVPWIASDIDIPMPGTTVISFALITAFLTLVLARFGVELRSAHEASLTREAELGGLVEQLETEIEERRQAEFERERAERERELLYELERDARRRAESSSARLSFLAEASHLLATTLDVGETLRRLTDLVVPRWADWCAVDLVDEEGTLRLFTVAHQDEQRGAWAMEMGRRYRPREGPLSPSTAVTTGKTQYLRQVTDNDLTAAARNEEHLAVLPEIGYKSSVIVPFVVRGTAIGSLTLVSHDEDRLYTKDDVVFFEELAARAAIAVDNSRLYQQTRRLNRELEVRVEQRTRELRNALSELESFAYSVSHDLRTPLRGIDGFSQTLLEDYSDDLDEAGVDSLRRIRRAASKMGQLIDALLTLSSLSRADLEIEEVDLSQMARDLSDDLHQGDPHRDVEVMIEPDMRVRGDRELLELALSSLLANAWKFSRVRERARIEIGSERIDGETVFFVRDNGVGFDMAYYDKLFAPFQRLHAQQFEGTGIGLAVAQRVLMRHGGRCWAVSEVDRGATFYFSVAI